MEFFKLICVLLTPIFLSSCKGENSVFSAGVSVGGTGMPSIGTLPPSNSNGLEEINPNQYVLWSAGQIEKTCENIDISFNLIDPITFDVYDKGVGYSIIFKDIDLKRVIGTSVKIKNTTDRAIYHLSPQCKPVMLAKSDQGELLDLRPTHECDAEAIVKIEPDAEVKWNTLMILPDQENLSEITNFSHYTFDINNSEKEKFSCEISYPLILEN